MLYITAIAVLSHSSSTLLILPGPFAPFDILDYYAFQFRFDESSAQGARKRVQRLSSTIQPQHTTISSANQTAFSGPSTPKCSFNSSTASDLHPRHLLNALARPLNLNFERTKKLARYHLLHYLNQKLLLRILHLKRIEGLFGLCSGLSYFM